MIALLRYAVLKSTRDHLLFALLFAPAVLLGAPILGVGVAAVVKGAPAWPMTLPDAPPGSVSSIAIQICCVAAALVASAGAFWIFRREVASHAMGSFLLAARSHVVVFTAAMYGAVAGFLSFLIGVTAIALLTAGLPANGGVLVLAAALACACGGAAGAAMVAISAEATMLAPVYVVAALVPAALLDKPGLISIAIAVVITLVFLTAGSLLMRRRCAI